jgi:hypothetical protein
MLIYPDSPMQLSRFVAKPFAEFSILHLYLSFLTSSDNIALQATSLAIKFKQNDGEG